MTTFPGRTTILVLTIFLNSIFHWLLGDPYTSSAKCFCYMSKATRRVCRGALASQMFPISDFVSVLVSSSVLVKPFIPQRSLRFELYRYDTMLVSNWVIKRPRAEDLLERAILRRSVGIFSRSAKTIFQLRLLDPQPGQQFLGWSDLRVRYLHAVLNLLLRRTRICSEPITDPQIEYLYGLFPGHLASFLVVMDIWADYSVPKKE